MAIDAAESMLMKALTPPNENYPTCKKTSATFIVYSNTIEPELVSRRLEITPTQVLNGRRSPAARFAFTWFLETTGGVQSRDLRHHIEWLLKRLNPKTKELLLLQEEPETFTTISCAWWSASGHGGPTLGPSELGALSALRLEIGFDFYWLG